MQDLRRAVHSDKTTSAGMRGGVCHEAGKEKDRAGTQAGKAQRGIRDAKTPRRYADQAPAIKKGAGGF